MSGKDVMHAIVDYCRLVLFEFLHSINPTRWLLEVRWSDDVIAYYPTASEAIIGMMIKEITSLGIEPQPPALYIIMLPT
jgi:hypothetical protein